MKRREFIRGASSFAILTQSAPLLAAAPTGMLGDRSKKSFVEVTTRYGRLRGRREDSILTFKGVPYAGSPAEKNRFKAPTDLQPWTGVRDAISYGPRSIQPLDSELAQKLLDFGDPRLPSEGEDCLVLNIWTPGLGDHKKRPVMFYCHGGAFVIGSGGEEGNPAQSGDALSKAYDVVVVAINHRLGLLGYLYLGDIAGREYAASGNQGALDIVAALKWVRENIAIFGGDPDNVMIFGESGGGSKVATLLAMPSARGLFNKASIESSPTLRLKSRAHATEMTKAVLAKLKLSPNQWPALLEIPAPQLLAAQEALFPSGKLTPNPALKISEILDLTWTPVVDGNYLPQHPFDPVAPAISRDIPLMVGINKDETIFMFEGSEDRAVFALDWQGLRERLAVLLGDDAGRVLEVYRKTRPQESPSDLYFAITTAKQWWVDTIRIAELKVAQQGAPVYMYAFAYESESNVPGTSYPRKACHAMEIAFKFNTVQRQPASGNRPERLRAAKTMSETWAEFARTGNPNNSLIPHWSPYTLERRTTMVIDTESKAIDDWHRDERLIWEQINHLMRAK